MYSLFTTRTLTETDLPRITDLQQTYCAGHPPRAMVPAPLYLSPYFAGGQNVLCACSPDGSLIAYAPYFPQNDLAWVEIEIPDGREQTGEIRAALLDWLLTRARSGGQKMLNFQYFPNEVERIHFVQSQSARYTYSIYSLQCDLSVIRPPYPVPAGFEIRRWRMESEIEQRAYLQGRNECFPEAPISLEEWQFFASGPQWTRGINLAAFAGDQLAASVLVFWEPGQPNGMTEYVFTRAAYRGQGLARALLAEAWGYLRENGLQSANLEVKAQNDAALTIYRSLGYAITAESQVYQLSAV